MSPYQWLVIPLVAALVGLNGRLARRSAPVRNGRYVVAYSLPWRIFVACGLVFFLYVRGAAAFDGPVPFVLWVMFLLVVIPYGYGVLYFWRTHLDYDDNFLTTHNTRGASRTFRLADLRPTGWTGPLGTQFRDPNGRLLSINSQMQGASDLIVKLRSMSAES